MAGRGLAMAAAAWLWLALPAACLSLQQSPEPGHRLAAVNRSQAPLSALVRARRGEERLKRCIPCRAHGSDAPRLWMRETSDGFGSRMHNILATMAFAAKHGLNLGGIVSFENRGHKHLDQEHGEDILWLVSVVLGLEDASELFVDEPPPTDHEFTGINSLLEGLSDLGKGEEVLLTADFGNSMATDLDSHGRKTSDYWTPEFLALLRRPDAPLGQVPLRFAPGRPSVVMHVRRGDLHLGGHAYTRMTPDEWYIRIADHVAKRFGDLKPDIHVYTSLRSWPHRHNISEFDAYASRGMHLHFEREADGGSLEAWAHMIYADVFLMAKSEFSYVPALMNEKCVVYQKFWIHPLPGWIEATDGNWLTRTKKSPEFNFDEKKLDSCIADVKARLER